MSDNKDFYQAIRRMLKAAYKRTASADPEEFAALGDLPGLCQALEAQTVQTMRAAGYTWEHIGSAFGLTKQAAFKRWGRRDISGGKPQTGERNL